MNAPKAIPTRRNSDLRRRNSADVADMLRKLGRLDRAQLASLTTLSSQALATILNELVLSGHAIEVEKKGVQRGRGRPPLLYEYNANREAVISLYVGLRYSELSLCDGLGKPIANNIEFSPGWNVQSVVEQTSAHVTALLQSASIKPTHCHLSAVIHGWVDTHQGTATSEDMGWDTVPLGSRLAAATGMGVTVHEASRAAAIAEYREGAAAGSHRSIVLNVGPEITSTQVTDGVVDTGSGGFAGMIGKCRVPDSDGRLTPIDDLIGSFVTKQRYIEASGNHVDWMSDVYDRARAGDVAARRILEFQAEVIGFVSSWLVAIANPERLVLTGAMGDYDEEMRSKLQTRVVELLDPRMLRSCTIHFSNLGRQAWIRGGIHAALDHQQMSQFA
jgi:predicted NBD/HSP70 family sugar kinase